MTFSMLPMVYLSKPFFLKGLTIYLSVKVVCIFRQVDANNNGDLSLLGFFCWAACLFFISWAGGFFLFFCSWFVGSLCVGHRYFLYILYSCSALYPASRARVDFILQFVFLYYILHRGTVIKPLPRFLMFKPSIQRLQKGLRELSQLKNPSMTLQAV